MKTITANDAYKLIQDKNALLIDVREQEEYDQYRINNAIFAPLSDLLNAIQKIDFNIEQPVIFQCLKGGRSAEAILYLEKNILKGYELYNLDGGIIAWAQAG